MRYEYHFAQPYMIADSAAGSGTRGLARISLDARSNTEFGLSRSVINLDIAKRTGSLQSGSQQRLAQMLYNSPATNDNRNLAQQTNIDVQAFTQLGGLTAGRTLSFFTFFNNANGYIGVDGDGLGNQNLIAYTVSAGNGFTATMSLEDPAERRSGIVRYHATDTGPTSAAEEAAGAYGKNVMPETVLALRLDQSWGAIQASGVARSVSNQVNSYGAAQQEIGYAGQLGLKLNLPMIAAGDSLWLQAAYASGATDYIFSAGTAAGLGGAARARGAVTTATNGAVGVGINSVGASLADAATAADGTLKLAKSQAYVASFNHFWTPTVSSWVSASYAKIDWDAAVQNEKINPANVTRIAFGTQWTPIKGFVLGAEARYSKLHVKTASDLGSGGNDGEKRNADIWDARIRIQRDF